MINTFTVEELIDKLSKIPQNREVKLFIPHKDSLPKLIGVYVDDQKCEVHLEIENPCEYCEDEVGYDEGLDEGYNDGYDKGVNDFKLTMWKIVLNFYKDLRKKYNDRDITVEELNNDKNDLIDRIFSH